MQRMSNHKKGRPPPAGMVSKYKQRVQFLSKSDSLKKV